MTYTSEKLKPTTKSNPCPICADANGKCRTTANEIILCMKFADAFNQAHAPGYKYLHPTKDGLWGVYAPTADDKYSDVEREQWRRERQAARDQRASEERHQYANGLDLIARDREYRKLLEQLTLSSTDRKDLQRRGLTPEQIERGMYRTVAKWQPLRESVDLRLPGVSADGRSLNVSGFGYLIPIFDADGLIVGCQIRLRNSGDGGRYRWLTSKTKKRPVGPRPHLPNGELPIGVYRPAELKITDSIGTAEGHLKPFIAAQKSGQIILGAAGGQFASSTETFKRELDLISAELGGCKIVDDYIDAGAIANLNVLCQLEAKWKLLREWGYTVRVAWWGQFSKSASDIDELQDLTSIQWLTTDEFQYLQAHLLIEPDVRLNQRYLGNLDIPDRVKLLCVKSPKGTGKTEAIARLVEQYLYERPILVLSHRKQLVQALCDRFHIKSVYEVEDGTGNLIGYGLCVDSMHGKSQARFNAGEWKDGLVIIDEAEQVFWHALNASTDVKKHRIEVLEQMQKLCANVLKSEKGRIILSDADLTNYSIDFVLGMANHKEIKPYVIVNDYKPDTPWNVYSYRGTNPGPWYAGLEQEVAAGKRVLVHVDSQQVKSKYSARNIEARLRAQFSDIKILRLDSESTADPNHPAYKAIAGGLDKLIVRYDIVIATPVVETGLSLDLKGHFDCVFGCFYGVTGESQARQALARLREPVDRHIWLNPKGLGKVANGSTSMKSLLASENKTARDHIRQLQDAQLAEIETNPHPVALITWAKMVARHNAGLVKFRESVERALTAEGHNVVAATACGDLSEEMKENRDLNYQADCEAIVVAAAITDAEAKKLDEQKSRTEAQRRQLRKHKIEKRYCVPITADLIKGDDEGLYAKFNLHYYLTTGREFLSVRDKDRLKELTKDSKKLWIPDVNKAMLGAKIAMLDELGIGLLLNGDREFRGADLEEMATEAIEKRWYIKACLGITISPKDSPILVAQRLLSTVGLDLTRIGRDRVNGKAGANIYQFVAPDDIREEVFAAWHKRDITNRDQGSVIIDRSTATPDLPTLDPPLVQNPSAGPVAAAGQQPDMQVVSQGAVREISENTNPMPQGSLSAKIVQGMRVIWKGVSWIVATLGTAIARLIKVSNGWEDWCFDLAELSISEGQYE